MISILVSAAMAHVPMYTGACTESCCEPPHAPDVSQAVYLKGSGGLELHKADLDVAGGQIVDFNVVFKKRYNTTTFELYVGCGGCMPDDELLVEPFGLSGEYDDGVLEIFTQTAYFSPIPKGERRQFDTSALATCASDHFTVRLVQFDNATEEIVWSAVLGCEGLACERFTLLEYFLFPLYVQKNHGYAWNGFGWTVYVCAGVAFALIVALVIAATGDFWMVFRRPVADSHARKLQPDPRKWRDGADGIHWMFSGRCLLYFVATWAVLTDILESIVHILIAADAVGSGDRDGYWKFTLLLLFGKVAPLVLVALIWNWHREIPEPVWRRWRFNCTCGNPYDGVRFLSPLWAKGSWGFLEVVGLGFAGYFWLGLGYWVYPTAMGLAGLLRLYNRFAGENREGNYVRLDETLDKMATPVAAELPTHLPPLLFLAGMKPSE